MKKLLLSLFAVAASFAASAAEATYTVDFTSNNLATTVASTIKDKIEATLTLNGGTWTFTNATTGGSYSQKDNNGRGIQIGTNKATPKTITFSTNAFNAKTIKAVTLFLAAGGGKYNINVDGSSIASGTYASPTSGSNTTEVQWTATTPVSCNNEFSFDITANSGKALYIQSFTITYDEASAPVDPTALAKPVIKYGDVTVSENDEISVPAGTTFNISADNAESITITNASNETLLSETGSTCTWTPTATAKDRIIVTATKEGVEPTSTTFSLDTRIETDFNFTVGSVGHDINDGKSLAAEKLKNGSDFNSLEPIAWSSSNTKVATIDEATGAITIIATGTTTIRADFAGNETTKPGYAEYTLNVADRNEETFEDVLTISCFPDAGNSYRQYTYTSDITGIVYTAKIIKGNNAIQTNDTSGNGIVTTSNPNGYVLKSVSVELNQNTKKRTLHVYCSNTDFASIAKVTDGIEIGSLAKADDDLPLSSTIESDQPYKAVGFDATGGALYIDKITLVWAKPADETRIDAELSVDGVATEWFDLSGRRVAAPAKGVYLRKQGSKVTKIAY